jgi:endonuclease/exonuclease/phosphatase family metal-dependent hydrolase
VKYAQIMNTCKNANNEMPILLCGDLNSRPDSNVYKYLTDETHEKAEPYKSV